MFTATLFAILLVYIREDAIEARKVIYGVMAANLGMTLLLLVFGMRLNLPGTLNIIDLPSEIFSQGARVMFSGTLALFADVLLIIFVFEAIRRFIPRSAFLRIFLTMAVILAMDAVVFSAGAFYGRQNFGGIVLSGILGKIGMAFIYTTILTLYLQFMETTKDSAGADGLPFQDIFSALTYREKYEITKDRAVEDLRESEERFRAIFNAANDAIFIHDPETGSILDVNRKAEEMFGLSREELLRAEIGKLSSGLPSFTQEDAIAWIRKAAAGIPQLFEWRAKDKNNRLFWVEINMSLAALGAVERIIVSVRDIGDRKEAELGLMEQRDAAQRYFAIAGVMLAVLDRNGKVALINPRGCEILGYDQEEIIGVDWFESLLPPRLRTQVKEVFQKLMAGDVEPVEYYENPVRRKDGEERTLAFHNTILKDDSGKTTGVLFSGEDITARKQAEAELKRINKELLAVNRIIMACASSMDTESILNRVLDEALAITELEGGTICNVTPEETLHIVAHRATSEKTIEDLSTHQIKIGDCLCGQCARDHKPLILRDREAVLKFSTREATRGEDIRFHAAFPLVAGERCLGVLCVFTRTDAKPAEESLELLETVSAQIAIAIDNAQLYEKNLHYADNLEDKVHERTTELDEARRALLNLVEDLNIANEKLKELDKLKSMFVANMSHELRTPLNSIIGFSSIILEEWFGPLNEKQKMNLSAVKRSGKHLLALINDVIDLSKIEAGLLPTYVEQFDIYEVIEEALENVERGAKSKGVEIIRKLPQGAAPLKTDKRRLLQCLLNLLSNAVKFTNQGSVTVEFAETAEKFRIEVTDTGIGIKEEDREKLFQPFSRLQPPGSSRYPGTGLGLHLTQKILREVLRGDIEFSSEPGKGSRFIISAQREIDA